MVTRVTWSGALMVTTDQRSTTSLFTWWTLTITTLRRGKRKWTQAVNEERQRNERRERERTEVRKRRNTRETEGEGEDLQYSFQFLTFLLHIWRPHCLILEHFASHKNSVPQVISLLFLLHRQLLVILWIHWMNKWMSEWMNEWVNEWMNKQMNKQMNEWMSKSVI